MLTVRVLRLIASPSPDPVLRRQMLLPDQMVTVRVLPLTARVPGRAPNRPTRRNQTRIVLIAEDQTERAPATRDPIDARCPASRC